MTTTTTKYRMPIEDVLDLLSGDYLVPMREVRAKMNRPQDCWHSEDGFETCDEFIHYLAARMREYGWDGPPVCIGGRSLTNGHHRVLAAWDAGLQNIPYTTDWEESGGSPW